MVVLNSLVVIEGGVRWIEGIVNGIGEWVGNVVFEEVVFVLYVWNDYYGV